MSTELHNAAACYVGYIEQNPVCFLAVLHFPHPQVKNFKKIHRVVVLPDYQGLGIGHAICSDVARDYKDSGYRFVITSSAKSLLKPMTADPRWIVTRKGRTGASKGALKGSTSEHKMTYSYEYIGTKQLKN